jgi:bacterial/archaeal transporter family-2 protein
MDVLAIPFLLFVGALLAVQAAANVQLSSAMASPFAASTLQLGIGAALMLSLTVLAGSLGAFDLVAETEPWALVGGLGSAIYITSGIVLFPRLGAVVTVGLWIAGQMLASLALDGFGWLGVAAAPLGMVEAVGGLAVLSGAALLIRTQTQAPVSANLGGAQLGWVALAVLAGAALPLQGAINAELRADLDAPIAAGAVSFVVATTAMAGLLLGSLALAGGPKPRIEPLRRLPWWGWLGGLVGAAYVVSVFSLIPEIGAAATIALTVAGQQLASVAVDRFGLLRLQRRPITGTRVAAAGALLAGVVLIQVA